MMYFFNIIKKWSCAISLKTTALFIFLMAFSSLNSTPATLSLGHEEDGKKLYYFTKTPATCEAGVDCNIHHYYEPIKRDLSFQARESCRVDLHGYSVEQARLTVKNIIQQAHGKNIEHIHFICGRGKHINAQGSRGAIFKAFPQWLESEEISPYILRSQKGIGTYEIFLNLPVLQEETSGHILKIDLIKNLAKKNDSHAQLVLGDLYNEGRRLKKDPKEALKWYKKAAIQGLAEAQVRMGYMCAMGLSIHYNPQEALFWYKEAAKQDYPPAYRNLATMYYVGEGVTRDYNTAMKYYLKAGNLNDSKAMNMLGILYCKGEGVPQDKTAAIKWYRRAAEAGEPHAKVNLGFMLLNSKGIDLNEAEGIKWLQEGAEYGLAEGQLWLGLAYMQGQGVDLDYEKALRWLLKASLQKSEDFTADAQFALAYLYDNGKGVRKNI